MDPKAIWTAMQTVTGGIVLALLVAAIIAKKLVPGWTYDAVVKDRDDYRRRLFAKIDPGGAPPEEKP